jgi:hypothetical protein
MTDRDPTNGPSEPPQTVAEDIRVANLATYWPVAPLDLVLGAPMVARLLLGATPAGRVVQAVALAAYLGSALRDWRDRRSIRRIDFHREFGADLDRLVPMPRQVRVAEVATLAERLNDEFTGRRLSPRALAVEVDRALTTYIAGITGQRVHTSVEIRRVALARFAMPSALGACDVLSGDVAIFKDAGLFTPHIVAHEFAHRKGYWKELHAQVLAYCALAASTDPVLRQSARLERVYRGLRVLGGHDDRAFTELVAGAQFRDEVRQSLLWARRPPSGATARQLDSVIRNVYDARMRLTGQNGISDYDLGFTNFLHTFEISRTARQRPPPR